MKKKIETKPIIFPTPVLIVATYNEDGSPNAMNAAWGGICASEPPSVMVAIRKSRKTYENISKRKAFTINIPNKNLMEVADFFGIASGHNVDKFKYAGVTAVKGEQVDAPYIDEFPVCLECKMTNTMEMGTHMLIIGEIVKVMAEESVINEKGIINVEKVGAIGFDPAGSNYTATGVVVGKAFSVGIPMLKQAENNK